MESLYLKTFVEVVRTGSLSRAAEILHVTQPAVSRRMKFMEDQYNCALLDRSANPVRPTEAGRLVYEKAKALLEIESDLVAGLSSIGTKTRIAFSSTPAFAVAHLPAILRRFMIACAESAELRFVSSTPDDMLRGLTEGSFDAAVIESCEQFDLSAFTVHPLPDAEVLFAAAPSLGVSPDVATIDAILHVPLFTRREGCCSRTLLERGLREMGRTLGEFRRVVVLDDLHTLVRAVVDGGGLSFLPADLIEDQLADGRLRAHRLSGMRRARTRALVLAGPADAATPMAGLVEAVLAQFDPTHPEPALPGADLCSLCPDPVLHPLHAPTSVTAPQTQATERSGPKTRRHPRPGTAAGRQRAR